ncbi:serine peptidase [Streptomyces sp. 4N509B]|uniref:serine peptidase n=1 Tax=Streptomyces sp. 4N509B TaxID=3457413 RepID=UPI003FD38B95
MTSPALAPLRVVAVHGVGNHLGSDPSPTRLQELRALRSQAWARHIAAGLDITPERLDVDFAYYADRLLPGPAAQGGDDADLERDPVAREMLSVWARALGLPDEIAQGHATVPLRALAAWVARKYDLAEGPLRVFIRLLFREVAEYLRSEDSPQRAAAREEVAARIARHQPDVVVAHSLGSVVTYEALHAHPELRPRLLLTLGSPLALPRAVFHRLIPAPSPAPVPAPTTGEHAAAQLRGHRPPGVDRWVNIADPGDPVAIPPGLSRHFDGVALDHTTVVGALFDFHNARNYLRSATTAATLAPYLSL